MKKILIGIFIVTGLFSSFINTYADYYSFCDEGGNGKDFIWITKERLESIPINNNCDGAERTNVILGNLGNGEHALKKSWSGQVLTMSFDNHTLWSYDASKINSSIVSWVQPSGISQNGKHNYFGVLPFEGGTEKEMKEYIDKNKQIMGAYIDGVRVYTNTDILEQAKKVAYNGFLESLDLDFYFGIATSINGDIYKGTEYKNLDRKNIEKYDDSLFPLSSQEEDKLDTYISSVSKVKRGILLPKLQTYYKDTSKSYKKRIAVYYIYAELMIQKLKENPL